MLILLCMWQALALQKAEGFPGSTLAFAGVFPARCGRQI
jgi:hypothetical protein